MQIIKHFKLFFLTILNCIFEFLPISSTAHNLILLKILSIKWINVDLFLSFLQLPITITICIYFYKDIKHIFLTFFSSKETRIFCYKTILTIVPTIIFGIIFNSIIKLFFYNNLYLISIFLIIGGILMIKVNENKNNIPKNFYEIDIKTCIRIGIYQMFSLIPGISRSAITIYTALKNHIDKKIAVNYSFFISVPISFLACIYNIYKNYNILFKNNISNYIIFLLVGFIFSLIFIKFLINFLINVKFKIFGYYRIIVGLLTIIIGYLCHL